MALDLNKLAKGAAEAAGKAASVAADVAKAGAETVAAAAVGGAVIVSDAAERAQIEINERRYKPLFLEEYEDADFDRPKLVVVSDEDERKGVDTCVGAIGWMRRDLKPEVMHVYEEFVPDCGLSFYPRAICDAAYYIDPFDSHRYIELSQFLSVARRDQMTELKQIAHMLGAKECRLEYTEETKTSLGVHEKGSRGFKVPIPDLPGKGAASETSHSVDFEKDDFHSSKVLFEQIFEGDTVPSRPELKWYKDDNEILDLIETRLDDEKNTTKSYHVEISSFASMCMSSSQAMKIDASFDKAGIKGAFSLSEQYETEVKKKMVFEVVF